jgi:hypothetical protein
MEHLISPNPAKVKGCELVFPDTVWFNLKGTPSIIVRSDKDFCLIAVKTANKLRHEVIYQEFSEIMRKRKKDQNGVFS